MKKKPNSRLNTVVLLENSGMRLFILLIYFFGLFQISTSALAVEKNKVKHSAAAATCSADEITMFKEEYVKLQNSLKYKGKNIELKNGKSRPIGNSTDVENSPGQKVEEALYDQYKNALTKIGAIYQQLNKEPTDANKKIINDNPDIAKFFKAIDSSNTDKKGPDNIDIDTLLVKLQKVQIKGFELKTEDIYLLKNLFIHSQDRICTFEQYNKNNKGSFKTAYLEQLKKSPLNKMIESLNSLDKTKVLKLANEEIAISQAIKDSLEKMRKIIKDNKSCETKLMNSPLLGDIVQTCNYNKFIKSISANQFNEIESILHFLNANQHAKNAPTDLDWINTQFLKESKTSCLKDPTTNEIYVQYFPFIGGDKIDTSKISCSKGPITLKPADCIKGLKLDFVEGLGIKVSSQKIKGADAAVSTITIKDADQCNNVALSGQAEPVTTPPVAPVAYPKSCDQKLCLTLKSEGTISWNAEKKACISTKFDEEGVVICSETTQSPADLCILEPNKEWVDNACKDKALNEADCKKAPKKEWKENKCINTPEAPSALSEEDKCKKKQTDWEEANKSEAPILQFRWDEAKKDCVDRQASKSEPKEVDSTDDKPEVVYPNKPVPGRFTPVTIPTRQVYILPGMP